MTDEQFASLLKELKPVEKPFLQRLAENTVLTLLPMAFIGLLSMFWFNYVDLKTKVDEGQAAKEVFKDSIGQLTVNADYADKSIEKLWEQVGELRNEVARLRAESIAEAKFRSQVPVGPPPKDVAEAYAPAAHPNVVEEPPSKKTAPADILNRVESAKGSLDWKIQQLRGK